MEDPLATRLGAAGLPRGWWTAYRTAGCLLGTYAAMATAAAAAMAVVVGAAAAGAGLPVARAAQPALAAWWLLGVGHAAYLRLCRAVSRRIGLGVAVLVPEPVALTRWLHRRRGLPAPGARWAFSVHVDPTWPAPRGLSPEAAARRFGEAYRADYDRILGRLAGLDALVASSTFNRHDSLWTERALREGWGWQVAGPLFAVQPLGHRPAVRCRAQRRMFGGVVTGRRVDRREAWRTRLFACAGAAPGA